MNVLDAFARMARANPNRPALSTRGRTLTYQQLWRVAGAMAWHLADQGVKAGDCVAVTAMAPDMQLVATIAIARMGAISTPVPVSMPVDARRALLKRHGARFAIHSGAPSEGFDDVKQLAFAQIAAVLPEGARPAPPLQGLGEQVWRIALSSAAGRTPRSVAWTHARRSALQSRMLDVFPAGPGESLLVYADFSNELALAHALTQLASGGALIVGAREASADAFLALLEESHPTRVMTSLRAALQIAAHFKSLGREAAQNGLLSLHVPGVSLPAATLEALEAYLCPNVLASYAPLELGVCSRSDPSTRLESPKSAGRLMPWLVAQALDDAGKALPPGEQGELRFRARGGEMASRSVGAAGAADVFRGGWFQPGLRGSVGADGYLYLASPARDAKAAAANEEDA